MVKPHLNDIRMARKCIRATYGQYRVHTTDMQLTYNWDTDDIRLHMNDMRMP